jgi:hypothetical protein
VHKPSFGYNYLFIKSLRRFRPACGVLQSLSLSRIVLHRLALSRTCSIPVSKILERARRPRFTYASASSLACPLLVSHRLRLCRTVSRCVAPPVIVLNTVARRNTAWPVVVLSRTRSAAANGQIADRHTRRFTLAGSMSESTRPNRS